MNARHLIIHGRVQGVGFRASLAWEAQRLGLTGWVRNRREGTVEAVVCGDEAAALRLVEWARGGPPGARVERIDVEVVTAQCDGFELRPSV